MELQRKIHQEILPEPDESSQSTENNTIAEKAAKILVVSKEPAVIKKVQNLNGPVAANIIKVQNSFNKSSVFQATDKNICLVNKVVKSSVKTNKFTDHFQTKIFNCAQQEITSEKNEFISTEVSNKELCFMQNDGLLKETLHSASCSSSSSDSSETFSDSQNDSAYEELNKATMVDGLDAHCKEKNSSKHLLLKIDYLADDL